MTMYRITATLYYGKTPLRAAPLCTPLFCQRCDLMSLKQGKTGGGGVFMFILPYTLRVQLPCTC